MCIKIGDRVKVAHLDCCAKHIAEFKGKEGEVKYVHRQSVLVQFSDVKGTDLLRRENLIVIS